MNEPKSYAKQAQETPLSWRAFQDYLTLKNRGLSGLHQFYKDKTDAPTTSKATLKNWYDRYGWKKRADDYDNDQGLARVALVENAQRKEDAAEIARFSAIHRDYGVGGMQSCMNIMKSISEYCRFGEVRTGAIKIESTNELSKLATILSKLQPSCSEAWAMATGINELMDLWNQRENEEP